MSLTQENAVDLHIVGRDTADLLTTARVGGGEKVRTYRSCEKQ
jgi:hypothetical protein